jgi:hypothetical protein
MEPIAQPHPLQQLIGYLAIPLAFVAVMLGRTWWARGLGVLALVPGVISVGYDMLAGTWIQLTIEATVDVTLWLAVVCLFLPVTRTARRAAPAWWVAGAATVTFGAAYGLWGSQYGANLDAALWWQFLLDTAPGWAVALACLGYLTVVRTRRDRTGALALALGAAALVTVLAQIAELVFSMSDFAGVAMARFLVFTGLAGALLVLVVVMATIGIRRYFSSATRLAMVELD